MVGQNNSANVHARVEERLSDYLDNRLAENERARIEQHLRECADCRASLESLRWTIALVKQAPAPALPRAFTLPVPAQRAARPAIAFGFAQFATALATLLLLAVIGVDVLTQLGGMTAMAPSAAKEYAAPTLAVAAAPPTMAKDQVIATAPAQAVEAPKPAAPPTAAPRPTMAPPAAALPAPVNVLPTATAPRAAASGAPETPETKGTTTDSAEKSRSATAAFRAGLAITATTTIPAPTATLAPTSTATSVPPTATALPSPTVVAQARAEATRAPQPTQIPRATAQSLVTPLRVVELGLLFLAVFFGALVVVMWKKR